MKKENEEKMLTDAKTSEKNKKKSNGKKIIILVVSIVVIILLLLIIYNKLNTKKQKASEIFGNGYCEAILHMSTMDLVIHKCEICGTEFKDSSTHADICEECAKETNRCDFCGKILTKEIKQQRENLLNN